MRSRGAPALLSLLVSLLALSALPGSAGAAIPARTQGGQPTTPRPVYMAPRVNTGDWPTYGHDVSRTNFNPDETLINILNVSQLVQRWQGSVPMASTTTSSSPSVSGGRVFVGASVTSGNNFFAFDAVNGGLPQWGANLAHNGCLGVGIGSSSAVSGTIVTVGGSDSAFYALDTETGGIIWRHPITDLGTSAWPWASPLLAYDQVYLGLASCADNPSVRGEVRAVNIYNGTPTASKTFVPSDRRGAGVWNSPALSPDGTILAVATGEDYGGYNGPYNRAIVALDPITLDILGSDQRGATGSDQDYGTTPVIFHDSTGRLMVGANHKNGTFYAFDLHNVSAGPVWSRATGTSVGMMPAYDPTYMDGGTLFIAGGSRIMAVDPATGTDRWPGVTVGTMHGNMALANHLIFANAGSAGMRILDESTGSIVRTIIPSGAGSANSGIAVSNGFIYWLSGSFLNAWSLPGTPNTPTDTPTITPTSPPTDTPTITPTSPPTDTPPITPPNQPTGTPTTTPTNTPTDLPPGAST
ncbi:MAG: PQQ-binding-like beta-propeller repeat protein, partial [Chloroflexia bacterium]